MRSQEAAEGEGRGVSGDQRTQAGWMWGVKDDFGLGAGWMVVTQEEHQVA